MYQRRKGNNRYDWLLFLFSPLFLRTLCGADCEQRALKGNRMRAPGKVSFFDMDTYLMVCAADEQNVKASAVDSVLTHVNIFRSIACENTSFDAIKVIWCDNACAMKIMYI